MKLRARSLDQTLDHQNIWLWAQACNVRHADRCVALLSANRLPSQMPNWVIDTITACIVPGSVVDRYTALSYVWPSLPALPAETLLLERATLREFQDPGFLSLDCNLSRIPQVIQDAIRLTQGVGERYLWVDRLCLVQNDDSTYTEVQRMHEIYWGAYLTIVAATSASLYGCEERLQGPSPNQQEGDLLQHPDDNSSWSAYHLALIHEHYARLSRSKWGNRGWTYQEKILSRRTIVLLDDDMFWDCQCALWDCNGLDPFTEITHQVKEDGNDHHNVRLTPITKMDFSLYVELVCPYNARDLSFAQDVIPAFTGILNTLAPAFPGGFVAGIPLAHLASMLLWQPRKSAARRKGTTNPSWSWTGWRCEIDPWSLRSGLATATGQPSALQRAGSWLIRDTVECVVVSPEASWHVAAGKVRAGQAEVRQDGTLCFGLISNNGSFGPRNIVQLGSVDKKGPPVDALIFLRTSSAFFVVLARETAFQEPPEADVRFRKLVSDPPKIKVVKAGRPCSGKTSSFGAGSLFGSVLEPNNVVAIGSVSKVSVYESSFSTSFDSPDEGSSLILSDTHGNFAGVVRMFDDSERPEMRGSIHVVRLIALSLGSVKYRELDAEYKERWRWGRSQTQEPGLKESSPPYASLCRLLYPDKKSSTVGASDSLLKPQLASPLREGMLRTASRNDLLSEDDEVYEFYNVLLIKQQGDIVCRQGCGRVPKKIWVEHALPSQEFIIG